MADTTQSDVARPSQLSSGSAEFSTTSTEKFFNFTEIKPRLSDCVNSFKAEIDETKVRRKLRSIDVNIKKMRQEGTLNKAETYIPVRTIETNIAREKPPFISYIKQPQRLMIFSPLDEPTEQDCRRLESEFTKGMTYTGWELTHFKILDGAQSHGWDFVEVVYNPRYPLKCCIEHVGHDNLFFELEDTIDIQFNEFIIRRYSISVSQLKDWATRFDFEQEEVQRVLQKITDKTTQRNKNAYKLFFRSNGIIYTAWFMLEEGTTNWLKKPTQAFVGIKEKKMQPVTIPGVKLMGVQVTPDRVTEQEVWVNSPLTDYPIFPYYYTVTEDPKIKSRKGRVWLDEHKQEAQTATATSYVNSLLRASRVYGSPKSDDGSGSTVKNLDVNLVKDGILSKPFEFWHFDYPPADILRGLQYFDVANQQETGQLNYAAQNRVDSRKTAAEIESSNQDKAQLSSVQVILFSVYMRQVYNFVWKIVQSQALQYDESTGTGIKFLQIAQQSFDSIGNPVTLYVNDVATISRRYDLRPAGDVDFIQRQFTISSMMADWPVVANIPGLREIFLADLMRLKYADKGEKYANLVMQGAQELQLLAQAAGVIEASMTTAEFNSASPETKQQTMQLLTSIKQSIGMQQKAGQSPQQEIESTGSTNGQP